MNPVIYVFVNKGLGMTAGKLSAQAAHAVALVMIDETEEMRLQWRNGAHKTMLIMEAKDENHIRNIERYLVERKVPVRAVVDEGVNEIDPHTITAMATAILNKDDEQVGKTFSTFSLYRDTIRVNLELDR
jgi:peptidyl-tRNA hydrolase